jgi:hypothetical protein
MRGILTRWGSISWESSLLPDNGVLRVFADLPLLKQLRFKICVQHFDVQEYSDNFNLGVFSQLTVLRLEGVTTASAPIAPK